MSDWVVRLSDERRFNVYSYFVTLTYSNENLPLNNNGDPCLNKRDLQLWFKRLRKVHRFRYFAVGEYGSRFGRPHYHAILFSNEKIERSALSNTWGLGHVHRGNVTIASISYVAKYVFSDKGSVGDRPPTFTVVSKRPGIGFDRIKNLPPRNYLFLNGHKKRLPRYYKDRRFTKEEKQLLREETLIACERQYIESLEELRSRGYLDPVSEFIKREREAFSQVIKKDNSKYIF